MQGLLGREVEGGQEDQGGGGLEWEVREAGQNSQEAEGCRELAVIPESKRSTKDPGVQVSPSNKGAPQPMVQGVEDEAAALFLNSSTV